jgi:hypothetical protein
VTAFWRTTSNLKMSNNRFVVPTSNFSIGSLDAVSAKRFFFIRPTHHVEWKKLLLLEPTYQLPCVTIKKTAKCGIVFQKIHFKKEQFESALTLDHYVAIVDRATT